MLELETIFTILGTLEVVALIAAVLGPIAVAWAKKQFHPIDLEQHIDRKDTEFNQNVCNLDKDTNRRIDDEQTMTKSALSRLERNLDKRFDNVWSEVHKLDKTVNPNKDLLKD